MDNVKIIAIPVMGKTVEHKISKLFARSPYFIIFDEKHLNIQFVKNDFKGDQIKSGKHITRSLVARGVNVFCGYDIGFNVQKIAEENNIQLILLPENKQLVGESVIDIIKKKQ
jgi:predicted Fe-Mo cluster-binding NifX family protein